MPLGAGVGLRVGGSDGCVLGIMEGEDEGDVVGPSVGPPRKEKN